MITPAEPDEATPTTRAVDIGLRVVGTLLAVVLAGLIAVIGAFLTPFRVGTTLVPISLVIEVVGNVGVIWFAYQVTRNRLLALLPALVWVVLSFLAARKTTEGDLVLIGSDWVASAYLLLGPTAIAVCAYRLFLPSRRI